MTIKPTYAIHLWNNGSREMMFSVIENNSIPFLKRFYEYHEMINGKLAVVFVFFNDYDIRREDCIKASTRFMRGDYVRFDVNLETGEVTKKRGVDLTNPPL